MTERKVAVQCTVQVGVCVHPLEPANSPTLTTGHKMLNHRIEGISDDFIPPIVNLGALDAVVTTVFPDDNKKYLSTGQ